MPGQKRKPDRARFAARHLAIPIGAVWIFHGLYSKILGGIPRHGLIVERILGENIAATATPVIGVLEILLGLWTCSRLMRKTCATVQTLAILSMNTLEILLAKDLLISPAGMLTLNFTFLALVWYWAASPEPSRLP